MAGGGRHGLADGDAVGAASERVSPWRGPPAAIDSRPAVEDGKALLPGRTVRLRLILRKGRHLEPRLYAVYLHAR